ncbi:MAG TPA: 6-bladed beta-propeller [Bacteroidales bacterium]|nr:6-bladed beta-propeller [Bacteroidales bacterium]HQG37262.1 6-bladed beta-propeller [Bacteroidales bacterium]HQG53755.1 6-bladed beta-propeller [Bacteroidales bacterium]
MQKVYLSEFTDNIWYVPLESNPDFLLYWTYNNLSDFSENYILYSDGKMCLLYDNEGRFIRPIGKQGRGPGEYIGIDYIALINEKIFIHDYFTDDLLEYNIDGTFINRNKSGFTGHDKYRLRDAIMINDSMIFGNIQNYTGHEEYKALIVDKKGNIKYPYKNYIFFDLKPGVPHAQEMGEGAIFSRFGEIIYFKEPFNDTLFQIDNQFRLIPFYIFNFGKYKFPLSERGKAWADIDLSSYIFLNEIFQTKNYLFVSCRLGKYFPAKRITPEIIRTPSNKDYIQWYNTQSVLGIFDERKGDIVFSEPTSTNNHLFTSGIYNDIDAGPRFFPDKMVNDSTMMMKIKFDYLVEHIESNDFKYNIPKYPERKKKLEMLVDSLKKVEFDNPVYMFVTFKSK